MYLSAFIDKGFSGRGFINPPASGWVERLINLALFLGVLCFINPPASGWVESNLSTEDAVKDFQVSSTLPLLGGLKDYRIEVVGQKQVSFINPPASGWVESWHDKPRILEKNFSFSILTQRWVV